jgi:hypothetical protein
MPHTVRSDPVGTSLRCRPASVPSGEKYSMVLWIVPPCCSRSSTPMMSQTPLSLAMAPSRSVAGPGTTTAFSASSRNQSSSRSQIGWVSIQIGVPGMKTSGNATS